MDSRLDWTAPTAVDRILGRIDGSITKSELLTHRIPGHRPRLHTLNDIAVMLVLLYWAVRGVDTPVDQHGIKC